LQVPIVQGEFALAHLCRLVGTLAIPSEALTAPLPVGTEVELTLELDRGGQLRALARVDSIQRTFDDVALLVTPSVSPEALDTALVALRTRGAELSRAAFKEGAGKSAIRISEALKALEEVQPTIIAARGGDLDALEQARRRLADVDAQLAELEVEAAWPTLREEVESAVSRWIAWVGEFGGPEEKSSFNEAAQAARRALVGRDTGEVTRQLELIRRLGSVAYHRHPESWRWEFDYAAARVGESTDIRRATELVTKGREALRQQNRERLQQVVRELWQLDAVDRQEQALGHGSGLRSQ
jgi:molecular chaperone DnaK